MKILFVVPYPLKESPSQRFRFEQYFEHLLRHGHNFRVQTFLESHNWRTFFKNGNLLVKLSGLLKGFLKRFLMLLGAWQYDFIFIHREASPIGPPIIEWILAKLLRRKIIYDFDDGIWMKDRKDESVLLTFLKWRNKVASICKWSYKVSCGNHYLGSFARNYNSNVVINPTTIDTDNVHNPDLHRRNSQNNEIIIGWTGSHSTLKYLVAIEPALQKIEKEFPNCKFIFIADRPPVLQLKNMQFIPWRMESEIADLSQIDIGIMPLPDDEWAKGKCGFKALQYMALRIPTVASPVGVNSAIINHATNGFLATTLDEWYGDLKRLINNTELRATMGAEGRKTILASYSVASNSANFLALFD